MNFILIHGSIILHNFCIYYLTGLLNVISIFVSFEVFLMKISCVSCDSMFYIDVSHMKTIGSLVRCPKCHFIFMVNRLNFAEKPVAEDTNIDQLILADLYETKHNIKPNNHLMKSLRNRIFGWL